MAVLKFAYKCWQISNGNLFDLLWPISWSLRNVRQNTKAKRCIYAWLACVSCTSVRGVTAKTVMHLQSIIHPSVISCKVVDIWQLCPSYPLSILHSQTILALFLTISHSFGIFIFTKGSDGEYFATACNMAICWVTVNHNGFWRIIADALSICDFSREISVGGAP